MLHYAAQNGLLRTCKVLLEANVSINSIRRSEWFNFRGKKRTVILYNTALDEALEEGGRRYSTKVGTSQFEQGMSDPSKVARKKRCKKKDTTFPLLRPHYYQMESAC